MTSKNSYSLKDRLGWEPSYSVPIVFGPTDVQRVVANPRIWLLISEPQPEWDPLGPVYTQILAMDFPGMTFHDSMHASGSRERAVYLRRKMEEAERRYRDLYDPSPTE